VQVVIFFYLYSCCRCNLSLHRHQLVCKIWHCISIQCFIKVNYKYTKCAPTIALTCYSTASLSESINASHALLFSHLSLGLPHSLSLSFLLSRALSFIWSCSLSLVCCCYFAQALFVDAQKVKLQMYLQLSAACLLCSVTTHWTYSLVSAWKLAVHWICARNLRSTSISWNEIYLPKSHSSFQG
jgi:hypothetical protein